MSIAIEFVTRWLKGDMITLDGKNYVFPHGAPQIRKILKDHKCQK